MERACLWDEWYSGTYFVTVGIFTGYYYLTETGGGYFLPSGFHGFLCKNVVITGQEENTVELPGKIGELLYNRLTPSQIRLGGAYQVRDSRSKLFLMPDTKNRLLRVRVLYYKNRNIPSRLSWEVTSQHYVQVERGINKPLLAYPKKGYLGTTRSLAPIYEYLEALWAIPC